jgi:hypothetical protein
MYEKDETQRRMAAGEVAQGRRDSEGFWTFWNSYARRGISHDENMFETVYVRKTAKYQDFVTKLRRLRHKSVNVMTVIISGMMADRDCR